MVAEGPYLYSPKTVRERCSEDEQIAERREMWGGRQLPEICPALECSSTLNMFYEPGVSRLVAANKVVWERVPA